MIAAAQIAGALVLIAIHELARRAVRHRHPVAPFAAGTIASYLSTVAFGLALFMSAGFPVGDAHYIVVTVEPGFDAAGKLRAGDRIDAVDHRSLAGSRSLTAEVNAHDGAPVVLTIVRDGVTSDVTVQPTATKRDDGRSSWLLGIRPELVNDRERDTGRAAVNALALPVTGTLALGAHLREIAFGSERADPGGPKRIYETFERAKPDAWLEALARLAVWAGLAYLLIDAVRLALALRRR